MRNDFLEKLCTKCGEEIIPRPFFKNPKLSILWINSLTFYTVCVYCMPSLGLSKYIETKLRTTCFYLIRLLKKAKRGLELTSLHYFLQEF